MNDRIKDIWAALHSSFWFVPSLMALSALCFSFLTIRIDQATNASFASSLSFIWSGGAEGARSILSTVAGSMITVAGVVFSIVIVALTLASSQFGPRLLRNFVRDTGNQITLGTFIATFLYCLMVLRTIRVKNEGNFIPYISITCGMALTVASIGVLIYFIHHVSVAIQAENVIARVAHELGTAIDNHFPASTLPTAPLEAAPGVAAQLVRSRKSGYVQSVDRSGLVELARKTDSKLIVKKLPGDFVFQGDVLVTVATEDGDLEEKHLKAACRCFTLGDQRTESQDVRYGARQLSEIASRALSPGINDPYTAMGCIDWAAAALTRVASREAAPLFYADEAGATRLKLESPATFATMCAIALNPLIAYGLNSPVVACHLVFSLRRLVSALRSSDHASELQSYVERISAVTQSLLKDEAEKLALEVQTRELLAELTLKRTGDTP